MKDRVRKDVRYNRLADHKLTTPLLRAVTLRIRRISFINANYCGWVGASTTGISLPMKDRDRKDVGYDRLYDHKFIIKTNRLHQESIKQWKCYDQMMACVNGGSGILFGIYQPKRYSGRRVKTPKLLLKYYLKWYGDNTDHRLNIIEVIFEVVR